MNLTDEQKNELRHALLAILVNRHPTALSTKQVFHRAAMTVDFGLSDQNVEAALEVLRGLNQVALVPDDFGSTKYWIATSQGVIAQERRQK